MLGGMIAGNPGAAYDKGRLSGQAVATGDAEAAGDAAFGRALQALYAGPPPPTVPPGQPSMPQGGPPMGGPPGMAPMPGASPMPGGPQMSPGGPQMSPGGPPRPPVPMQPPGGMAQPGPGLPQGGQPPMGGGPQFGSPGGGIGWQQAVQAVVRANPGIDQNPRALARAVDHFMPIMNQQALAQWREMQLQFKGDAADARWASLDMRERQDRERTEREREKIEQRRREHPEVGMYEDYLASDEGQKATPQQRAEWWDHNVKGRLTGGEKKDIATTREARLQFKTDFDREFKTKSLDLAERRFGQMKNKQERDAAFREEKEKLTAQYNELKARISAVAGGATTDKQVKELEASYKEAVKNLESSFMGKRSNQDMKTGLGTLQAYPVPPDRKGDPDGTTYNNGQYKKQGDQIVPVQ